MEEGLFEGKVVLVTGDGSGIGQATALAFAKQGAKSVVSDIKEGYYPLDGGYLAV